MVYMALGWCDLVSSLLGLDQLVASQGMVAVAALLVVDWSWFA